MTSNTLLSAASSRWRTFGNRSGAVRIAAEDCGPLAEWIVVSRTPWPRHVPFRSTMSIPRGNRGSLWGVIGGFSQVSTCQVGRVFLSDWFVGSGLTHAYAPGTPEMPQFSRYP